MGFFVFPVWLALCAGIVAAAVPASVFVLALTVLYGVVAAIGLAAWGRARSSWRRWSAVS